MIGTFVTRTFDSRADFEEDRPSGIHVCRNRFTNAGLEWIWNMAAGNLRNVEGGLTDHLGAARLLVGNGSLDFSPGDTRLSGDLTAQAQLDTGFPTILGPVGDEGNRWRIMFRATFGEDEAVFDWQERGVVSAQGVLIDRAVADGGRKVLGAIWQLEAALDLTR